MFCIIFKSSEDHYHQPIIMDYLELAVDVALKYRYIAPKIMITDEMDLSVFEMEEGELVFPDRMMVTEVDSIPDIVFSQEDYLDKIEELDQLAPFSFEWVDCLACLFSVAARDRVNLYDIGLDRQPELLTD